MILIRDYNPQKPKEYHLERSLYLRVLHTVRDYPRMQRQIDEILYSGGASDGLPKSARISTPTENKAIAIAVINDTIDAIDSALSVVPDEYRIHIFKNVVYGIAYPDFADRSTWSRWRVRFLYRVAVNLKLQ